MLSLNEIDHRPTGWDGSTKQEGLKYSKFSKVILYIPSIKILKQSIKTKTFNNYIKVDCLFKI